MYFETFEGCCGVAEIIELDENSYKNSKEALEYLKDTLILTKTSKYGAIVVTLAAYQYKFWKPIMTKCGFIMALSFRNPKSGNMVSIYTKKL